MKTKYPSDRLPIKGADGVGSLARFLMAGALAVSGELAAAPGEIAQSPVFLITTGVQPNVFVLLDDSASMDNETLQYDGENSGGRLLDFIASTESERLLLCEGFNRLAYDPDITYTPWKGLDLNGNPFLNQDPTEAQVNPYKATVPEDGDCFIEGQGSVDDSKSICNLLTYPPNDTNKGAFYYEWTDANGDGEFQPGECPTNDASRVFINTLPATEQRNFANWFSYYRKRQFVVKRALSEVISKSAARVGLATINNVGHIRGGGFDVGTPVVDLREADNKASFLDKLLGMQVFGSTPLRIAFKRVGEYFQGDDPSNLFGFTPTTPPDSAFGFSPILRQPLGGDCQQNHVLVVSDGFWNGIADIGLGNTDGPKPDGNADSPYDGQSYADDFSDTMADIAMHYYETDLMPDLDDNVAETAIVGGTDDNPQQHLVTYTIAFGVFGNATCNPQDRETSVEDQGWPQVCSDPGATAGSGWPEPRPNNASTIDDMRHAAWNGRGLFLGAQNPDDLIEKLDTTLGDIDSRNSTAAAAVAVNSTSLQTGSLVFQAGFDSLLWSGTLSAFDLTTSGLGETPVWDAHDQLNDRNDRVIISFNGSSGVAFRFPENYETPSDLELSEEQINDLLADAPADVDTEDAEEIAANQAFGEALVGYLRGPFSAETEAVFGFRKRGGMLSDIVHSAPVFVGAPEADLYPEGIEASSYQAWANGSAKDRQEMVYVGTNGGSLHGFQAENGENGGREVFAYFPGLIFSDATDEGVHLLAQEDYDHRYYVDNTPAVTEVFITPKAGGGAQWRTILVGTLRGGGKGLFALDVSDPASFTEANAAQKVLWEFTHEDLGFTFSKPTLARLNNNRWAAIFGNGYNADGGDGTAKLFIHYLDDYDHSEVQILETGSGSIADAGCNDVDSDCNGLATPAVVDLGGDGIADRAYAGDLKGNLWAFDLTGAVTADWGSAYPIAEAEDPEPLFTAQIPDPDDSDTILPQPITTQPAVTLHPTQTSTATAPNTLVFFGTGQLIVAGDKQTTGVQSFYGVWDAGAPIARSDLVEQTISQTTLDIADEASGTTETFDVRTLSSNGVSYEPGGENPIRGWYVDFPGDTGERVVVDSLLFGELVVYTTAIPSTTQCGVDGNSWLMAHDFLTGGEPNFIAIDVNNNGTWDEEDVTEDGLNVAGVSTGDLFWQPTIVQSGVGAEGTVLLPKDAGGPDDTTLETQGLRGGRNRPVRSSWARFEFD